MGEKCLSKSYPSHPWKIIDKAYFKISGLNPSHHFIPRGELRRKKEQCISYVGLGENEHLKIWRSDFMVIINFPYFPSSRYYYWNLSSEGAKDACFWLWCNEWANPYCRIICIFSPRSFIFIERCEIRLDNEWQEQKERLNICIHFLVSWFLPPSARKKIRKKDTFAVFSLFYLNLNLFAVNFISSSSLPAAV